MVAGLASISVASIAIGFVSFAFTLAIWLHAFWEAFVTVAHADRQIQDVLAMLRQQLYEELEYMRRVRRRERERGPPPPPPPTTRKRHSHHRHSHSHSNSYNNTKYNDEKEGAGDSEDTLYRGSGAIRVLLETLKDLIAEFKVYEAPFLDLPPKSHKGPEKDLQWSYDATRQRYRCDLSRRLIWLRVKSGVLSISDKLQRIQTHRAAMEATECRWMLMDAMGMMREVSRRLDLVEDMTRGIEDRVLGARIVGG